MNIIITTSQNQADFLIPINFFFWGVVAAYVMHILEESLLGENFVEMVKKNFWPEYQWKHFFGFNTLLMSLLITSIICFEIFGGTWIIFPLTFVFLMATNGLWHLGFMIITKKYSPGILTSLLYWILAYFIIRYSFLKGQIQTLHFIISVVTGTLLTTLMIGSFWIFRKRFISK